MLPSLSFPRMRKWKHEVICPGFRARQFEYNPHYPELMVFGTLRGEIVVADHIKNQVVCADLAVTPHAQDSVLGLCWLHRTDHNMFVTGSSKGVLKLCEIWTSSQSETSESSSSGSSSSSSSSSSSPSMPNSSMFMTPNAVVSFES